MFQPNIKAESKKSLRIREPEPNWEPPIRFDKSMVCKHMRLLDEVYGEVCCPKCGLIHDVWFVKDHDDKVKNNNIVIWNREYDKSRWTGYSLDMMLGKNSHELTDQCWLEIMREIPDPFRWYDVYKAFQKFQLLKYWVAFGHYIGKGPKLNMQIMNYFNKYMDIGHGKYSISYYFLLYKFTQMFGDNKGDEQFIPLKNSVAWCKKTDIWWKEICKENDWVFYRTKVETISWNKEEHLRKFAATLKRYIQASLTYS